MRYTVTEKGGLLIGDFLVSVTSASVALARSTITQENFNCVVEVSDEHGRAISMSELKRRTTAVNTLNCQMIKEPSGSQSFFLDGKA